MTVNLTAHLSYACMLAVALRVARGLATDDAAQVTAAQDDALAHESTMTENEKLVFETAIQSFARQIESGKERVGA